MCAYGEDPYEVYRRVTRTAAKRHRGAECMSGIDRVAGRHHDDC